MAPVTTTLSTVTTLSLSVWTLLHQTTAAVVCWNLTVRAPDSPDVLQPLQLPIDINGQVLTVAADPPDVASSSASTPSDVGNDHLLLLTHGINANWRRGSKYWPPGGLAYPHGSSNSSSELEARDKHALLYIVVVLLFYSTGIVVAIVMYLKREKAEIEEEKAYDDYASFRSDPDRWARYFRVQRMIAHLDRVERQAAEKRRFELQRQQSRTSNASSSTCLQPMSPGAMPAAASDQARSSLPISTASSKRSSSWRGRHSRRTSSPQSGGGLRVVVVEAQTDADNQQLPSQSLGDQQPATVASRDTIQAAVKSRASAVRLSSSRSACGRLDCCCDGNSSAADSSKDKAPVDRPPKRALSFTGATSLRTVTPPAETVTSVALPTLLEVHRTLSVSSQFVLTSSPISRDDSRTIASSDNGSGGGSTMHTSTV